MQPLMLWPLLLRSVTKTQSIEEELHKATIRRIVSSRLRRASNLSFLPDIEVFVQGCWFKISESCSGAWFPPEYTFCSGSCTFNVKVWVVALLQSERASTTRIDCMIGQSHIYVHHPCLDFQRCFKLYSIRTM